MEMNLKLNEVYMGKIRGNRGAEKQLLNSEKVRSGFFDAKGEIFKMRKDQ